MNLKLKFKEYRFIRFLVYKFRYFFEKKGYIIGKKNAICNHGIKIASCFCIKGNYNSILIDENVLLINCLIKVNGNNNVIHLKKKSYLEGGTFFIEDNNCSIIIGENTFIGQSHIAVTENNSSIIIGDDCMLSSNINIRTGDSHSIIDIEKKSRINYAQNISIGNHCWIGEGAKILKGVILDENVIVATGAIVTSGFPNNVLIGGNPAKILKENVTWNKNRI